MIRAPLIDLPPTKISNIESTRKTKRSELFLFRRCACRAKFCNPDENRSCTSHIERLNLTLRMNLRRFTRLTNGHSKSLKHHTAMQAILFAWYNFCRVHSTIKATPAVAARLTGKVWGVRELLERAAEAYLCRNTLEVIWCQHLPSLARLFH
jgi:transposase InsO family protein